MKFYGTHSVLSKYPYYLHRLLLKLYFSYKIEYTNVQVVLLKTSLKYRFHPLSPFISPLLPHLLGPSVLPLPLAPFLQPLPQQFGPPHAKSKSVIKSS